MRYLINYTFFTFFLLFSEAYGTNLKDLPEEIIIHHIIATDEETARLFAQTSKKYLEIYKKIAKVIIVSCFEETKNLDEALMGNIECIPIKKFIEESDNYCYNKYRFIEVQIVNISQAYGDENLWISIFSNISNLSNIIRLEIDSCHLENAGVLHLSSYLKTANNISYLTLKSNTIEEETETICQALEENRSLKTINLGYNDGFVCQISFLKNLFNKNLGLENVYLDDSYEIQELHKNHITDQ